MTLLAPLGLLGLISLLVLLIIYIIRPNYQQRVISSTFIWKLSLKYKKKRIPISKLRNLLLILCQILILLCCTAVLARPSRELLAKESGEEAIIIVDCSASMRMQSDGESRFNMSLIDALDVANVTFNNEGKVSLILAKEEPEVIASRITPDKSEEFSKTIDGLLKDPDACTYGKSDIDKALSLCEDIIAINENANVFVYTDQSYIYVPKRITVYNMAEDDGAWNLSVLDAYTVYEEGFYNFFVDVVCYGRNFNDLKLLLDISGVNGEAEGGAPSSVALKPMESLDLQADTVYTIAFRHNSLPEGQPKPENMIIVDQKNQISQFIYSYESVHVCILSDDATDTNHDIYYDDSFYEDNEFFIYGGVETPLKVQYVSTYSNVFINQALFTMKKHYETSWDISIELFTFAEDAATKGCDLYIYEHDAMPVQLPTDGIVMVIAPTNTINGSGVTVGKQREFNVPGGVSPDIDKDHPLLKNIEPEHFALNAYIPVTYDDARYECLMSVMGQPVLLLADDEQMKVVYLAFDTHFSTFPLAVDFPLFFYNIFEYFYPAVVDADSYEVNEKFSVRSLGDYLNIEGFGKKMTIETFPSTISLDFPGSYSLTQETFGGRVLKSEIYVKVPSAESEAHPDAEGIYNPYTNAADREYYADWLLYIAIGLTALLFAEWLLQLHDNM